MNFGIIGLGFVGDAIQYGFREKGVEITRICDPFKLPGSSIKDVLQTDVVFVCVPTPMRTGGDIDTCIIESVLQELADNNYCGIVVIKSTIRPDRGKALVERHPTLALVANPEYLTERSARLDFLNQRWIVLGGEYRNVEPLEKFYHWHFSKARTSVTSFEVAMMAKYMTNVWFSVKVALMNEVYKVAEAAGVDADWNEITRVFAADQRVGPTHLNVPGPDGDFGFGGKCFPKDLNAFIAWAKELGVVHNVMNAAWTTNLAVRNNKDWLKIDGAVTKDYSEPSPS